MEDQRSEVNAEMSPLPLQRAVRQNSGTKSPSKPLPQRLAGDVDTGSVRCLLKSFTWGIAHRRSQGRCHPLFPGAALDWEQGKVKVSLGWLAFASDLDFLGLNYF